MENKTWLILALLLVLIGFSVSAGYYFHKPETKIVEKEIKIEVPKEVIKMVEKECPIVQPQECRCFTNEDNTCMQPMPNECDPSGSLNANIKSIIVRCSKGNIKVWDCITQSWR